MAKIHTPVPSIKLNDDTAMPMLAFGTGTAHYKRNTDEDTIDRNLIDVLKLAITTGYRHLDTAEGYKNELEVGIAIAESKIARSELFITTKASRDASLMNPAAAITTSLKKLQLEYVDLYLLHAPWYVTGKDGTINSEVLLKSWDAMIKIKEQGLAKSIGVSNFLPAHLDVLMTSSVPPSVNQTEWSAYLQRPALLESQKRHNIALAAYGSLAPITKASGGAVDVVLSALARKYAVSDAEILIRYCLDQDITAVTTTGKESRMSDYLRCSRFKLTPEEIKEISKAGSKKNFRAFHVSNFAADDWS